MISIDPLGQIGIFNPAATARLSSEIESIGTEIIVLLVFMVAMIGLGLLVFKDLERRVRVRGTLGQH